MDTHSRIKEMSNKNNIGQYEIKNASWGIKGRSTPGHQW